MLNYKMIDIKGKADERGRLFFIQNSELPFQIKRVFWMKPKKERGNHANRKTRQCMICLQGKCKINIDNGKEKEEITLDKEDKGLIIEPNIWRTISEFSKDCIILVLASEEYNKDDYIRNYKKFKEVYS